jgi:hypothetical protein
MPDAPRFIAQKRPPFHTYFFAVGTKGKGVAT